MKKTRIYNLDVCILNKKRTFYNKIIKFIQSSFFNLCYLIKFDGRIDLKNFYCEKENNI